MWAVLGKIGGLGLLAALVVNLVVGVRMARLGWRTRRLPEILLAVLMLLGAVMGLAVLSIAQNVTSLSPPVRAFFAVLGLGGQYAGSVAQVIFVWRVFRTGQTSAAIFYGFYAACLVGCYLFDLAGGGSTAYESGEMTDPRVIPGYTLRTGAAILSGLEGLLYLVKIRRQLRFSLAEPLVVKRFTYYVIATTLVGSLYAIGFAHRIGSGMSAAKNPPAAFAMGVLAVVAAIFFWLAFLRRAPERRSEPHA